MSKFLLIDPSLSNTVGHHHDFARHVLDAAAESGFEPILAGHAECRMPCCGAWPIRPAYRDGLWTHQSGSRALRWLGYAASVLRRAGKYAEGLRLGVQRLRDRERSRRFAKDTARVLAETGVGAGDLVFVPNMTVTEVLGLAELFHSEPPSHGPAWHLEFHFNIFPRGSRYRAEDFVAARALQSALWDLQAESVGAPVFLSTDTCELTVQYEALHAGAFATLPIPVGPDFRGEPSGGPHAASRERRICVAYVGDARGEKGYPHLPEAIGNVWSDLVETGRMLFVIQSNARSGRGERASAEARESLSRLPASNVQLLTNPLSSDEYRALVQSADVLLLPYEPEAYAARSSGILAEALVAGKPVIVPARTWLAEQLAREIHDHLTQSSTSAGPANSPTGTVPRGRVGVVCEPGPAGIADALREVAAHFDHYAHTARVHAGAWAALHNPRRLVEALIARTNASAGHNVLRPAIDSGTKRPA
jgi:glycosyltransferase involved in cell wall biosynthesis